MSNHSWPYRSLRPWIGLSDFVSSSGCCWICWVCHSMMPRKFHFLLFRFLWWSLWLNFLLCQIGFLRNVAKIMLSVFQNVFECFFIFVCNFGFVLLLLFYLLSG